MSSRACDTKQAMGDLDDSVFSLLSLSNNSESELDVTLDNLELSSTSTDPHSSTASSSNISADLHSSTVPSSDALTDFDSSAASFSDSLSESTDDLPESDSVNIDPGFRKPLYEGSSFSTWDSYLHIINYALRHSLSKKAVSDLLRLIALHLPSSSTTSLYKFKKFFLDLYEDISFDRHYCCCNCHSPFEDCHSLCPNGCSDGAAEFLTVSVEAQLRRKMQSMCELQ